jgi:hypothetical protein
VQVRERVALAQHARERERLAFGRRERLPLRRLAQGNTVNLTGNDSNDSKISV